MNMRSSGLPSGGMNQFLYDRVIDWVPAGSRVLDLGSGDGSFLERLVKAKDVRGEGVEKDAELVARSIERGMIVHQGDILEGLDQYGSQTFDYILMLGTFQELMAPDAVLRESFRVGRFVILAYVNLAYWRYRFQLMWGGVTPRLETMPVPWYESPNIQFFSIVDFREFCVARGIERHESAYFNSFGHVHFMPNFRAKEALSLISQEEA